MILSASRRTDIPTFYSEWMVGRLNAGFAYTRNPMNPAQIFRIPLSPDIVDAILFWTKDPGPLMKYLPFLDGGGWKYGFQFTLNPYEWELEPGLRDKGELVQEFIRLSKHLGKHRVFWRYDPILFNRDWTPSRHLEAFSSLCEKLSPYTEKVTISFVDKYAKIKSPLIREPSKEEMMETSKGLGVTARRHGLTIQACCEAMDLSPFGIRPGSCVDRKDLERICGYPLSLKQDRGQRKNCGCYESVDIGVYNTCTHGCVYCYANYSMESIRRNRAAHDPKGEFLLGRLGANDQVREKTYASSREDQLRLD